MYREYRSFAVAKTGILSQKNVSYNHSALGRYIGTVVDRAERSLSAGTRVHGVEVVDKSLHRLIGGFIGLLNAGFVAELLNFRNLSIVAVFFEILSFGSSVFICHGKRRLQALIFKLVKIVLDIVFCVINAVKQLQ